MRCGIDIFISYTANSQCRFFYIILFTHPSIVEVPFRRSDNDTATGCLFGGCISCAPQRSGSTVTERCAPAAEIQHFPSRVYPVYQNVYQNKAGKHWCPRGFWEHGRFDPVAESLVCWHGAHSWGFSPILRSASWCRRRRSTDTPRSGSLRKPFPDGRVPAHEAESPGLPLNGDDPRAKERRACGVRYILLLKVHARPWPPAMG